MKRGLVVKGSVLKKAAVGVVVGWMVLCGGFLSGCDDGGLTMQQGELLDDGPSDERQVPFREPDTPEDASVAPASDADSKGAGLPTSSALDIAVKMRRLIPASLTTAPSAETGKETSSASLTTAPSAETGKETSSKQEEATPKPNVIKKEIKDISFHFFTSSLWKADAKTSLDVFFCPSPIEMAKKDSYNCIKYHTHKTIFFQRGGETTVVATKDLFDDSGSPFKSILKNYANHIRIEPQQDDEWHVKRLEIMVKLAGEKEEPEKEVTWYDNPCLGQWVSAGMSWNALRIHANEDVGVCVKLVPMDGEMMMLGTMQGTPLRIALADGLKQGAEDIIDLDNESGNHWNLQKTGYISLLFEEIEDKNQSDVAGVGPAYILRHTIFGQDPLGDEVQISGSQYDLQLVWKEKWIAVRVVNPKNGECKGAILGDGRLGDTWLNFTIYETTLQSLVQGNCKEVFDW